MASWTTKQIDILMEWVEENNECSEKSIWAKRYYDFLYLLLYFPSIIITSYLSAKPNSEIIVPIIINQTITTFDKFFNFGKLAGEYENYANLYQNFSDRILEELVKPDIVKQNGTIFYHDMNLEKQRLGDKTRPIPWVVEKLYNYYKNNGNKEYTDDGSSNSSASCKCEKIVTVSNASNATSDNNKIPQRYNLRHHLAARTIQNAWYNWCVKNGKESLVPTISRKKRMPLLVKSAVQHESRRLVKNVNRSTINLEIRNPQTKMEKKLAKMIHEKDTEPELSFQMARFNDNYAAYDDVIDIARKKKPVRTPSFI